MLDGFSESEQKQIIFKERTLIHRGDDFKQGLGENIELNKEHQLKLKEDKLQGTYVSPEIITNKYKDLVSSWNVETPEGSEIEVLFKVKIEGEWSKWLSYGKWSSDGNRGSIEGQGDQLARMDIDTLNVINGRESEGFRYRIIMRKNASWAEGPKVKAIATTLRLSEGTEIELDKNKNWMVDLDVPERSQMVIPKIGNVICSPTSLAMVMTYYGHEIDTEKTAEHVLDKGADIYGNWSFNVAYAGSRGFSAYVARFVSANEIKDKIADGIPVIASIRTKSKEDLYGSPMAYPSGHLLVVRGFIIRDEEEYVIVNDPAAPEIDTVRREYKLSEFEKAWGKIVYILKID